ncbi:DNA-binding domain-containing protein [Methyloceanibacter sp.]|uniref:DNA-binding domain-containing protein n=1 Tax=Methyloceanibacter sp. TaxID=1965321 RepID=UPI002D564E78|nr:DNA-binding domain-containing protein [Methyloceanibacter sp.]HZP08618.1 DNA-binding domain-containing protein [Methyloceanibacter sp.]
MKSLKDIQDEFQRGILAGDDAILAEVNDSAKEERKVLFGVYRNAYVARLAEILGEDYEQVHAYLGDRAFANLVRAYIAGNPSDQRSARWFGRHMPAFIAKSRTFADHPEVAELAALEKALADAFDGPDAEALRLSDLAELPPEAWPALELKPHPTAIRLTFTTNAAEIWTALKNETAPPKPTRLPEPQALLVWREGFMARFKPLTTEEAMMWDEAAKGVRFSVLCEMVATFAGEDEVELRAASYLKSWVELGTLAGFAVPPAIGPARSQPLMGAGYGAGNSTVLRPLSQ